jgi:hypothetical protein
MGLQIEDGTGNGFQVKINDEHQMAVVSENHELQHHISRLHGQVYQVVGEVSDLWTGTNTLLHINGVSGSDYLPDVGTYFQIGKDTSYSSGGTTVSPVNMNFFSGNAAEVTAYKENPSVTGDFVEFDRWYPSTSMMTYNKHGSLLLGLNDSIEIRLTTNRPEIPNAWCRVTMMLIKNGE